MILLLMSLSFAEEPTYANIKKGEPAPFDGRLFNAAAVAQIITEHRLKDLDCDINGIREEDLSILRAKNKPLRPYFWLTGGFVMGTVTSIAIFKTVDQ